MKFYDIVLKLYEISSCFIIGAALTAPPGGPGQSPQMPPIPDKDALACRADFLAV